MSSSTSRPSKASKSTSQTQCQSQPSPQPKPSSSLTSHLALVELKTRILSSLSKLSDRDTFQIAVDDLEKLIASLPADGFHVILSSLLHDPASSGDTSSAAGGRSSPVVARRESIRLLSLLCTAHPDAAAAHLPKIIAHIVRRLKDPVSDSSVRDACRDAAGSLAALYLRPNGEEAVGDGAGGRGGSGSTAAASPVVGLFVKPLLEVMGEQNKTVQACAAMCLAKVVEGGGVGGGAAAFQRLCPKICKLIGGQSFLAKGALLSVISSLAQVGAVSSQSMPTVLQSIRECLESNDWSARKAAADTLSILASYPHHVIADVASQTIASLEAFRFDKVKPVRDSMMEALQLWRKVLGNGKYGVPEDSKDAKFGESEDAGEKSESKQLNVSSRLESSKDSYIDSSPASSGSLSKGAGANISESAAILLIKKAPSLKDKELNPQFFQNLETRSSDDVPVEVVLPRKGPKSSHSQDEEELGTAEDDSRIASDLDQAAGREANENHENRGHVYQNIARRLGAQNKFQNLDELVREKWTDQRGMRLRDSKLVTSDAEDKAFSQKDSCGPHASILRSESHIETFMNNKGNWLAIQRQLSLLERQQAHLMNMLQDFMGGSHDSLVTLENRVRGLERVVDEMARDLLSSRRGGSMLMGFEGSPGKSSSKYSGLQDYTSLKFGRGSESRIPFAERYHPSDSMVPGSRGGRDSPWRLDSEERDSYAYKAPRNGLTSAKRADVRLPRDIVGDQIGNRRAWEKGQGPFRLGEGPSARSVWQASKDEATLEAIRVAGEDNGTSQVLARSPIPELEAEIMTDGNSGQERGPLWESWTRAMDSFHAGDLDSAYAEVLSTGDDVLLVKLMERSGPVVNELSGEVAGELLHAVGQYLLEESLYDTALAWVQQLMESVIENGADFFTIPHELKKEILLNLHEASSSMELPEDWEGASVDQIMIQLASAWGINIQQLVK
ncbi:Microtubule-associated protein TORTIFOLIA1 [Apostasia shenzhenica]|uniref:Microtubule-associated protein TORTIFOLIA1 n=1 Tax=Apostasia shenzhenica TaxID=1088818 RepID=A0A2H9ZZF1_9ASPA|nr:Microtubule-associated protein TORTIFOLIA1 [Apostasia shenzhenica]